MGWGGEGVLRSLFNIWGALRRARSALVENLGEFIHAVQISWVFAWNSKHRGGLNPLVPTRISSGPGSVCTKPICLDPATS